MGAAVGDDKPASGSGPDPASESAADNEPDGGSCPDRVELRFPPMAGYVRTARLVAVAVARRAHFDDVRLDEFRLAVGEACARAVRRCQATGSRRPVMMVVSDSEPGLCVEVCDEAADWPDDDPVVVALLRGLADRVEVIDGRGGAGGRVRMSWGAPGDLAADNDDLA